MLYARTDDGRAGQDFEGGLGGWTASGQWHVQTDPQQFSVIPAINPTLVTLPDSGNLPQAYGGNSAAFSLLQPED